MSERTAEQIDDEVRGLVERLYSRVQQILQQRRQDLENLVAELKKKEALDREELDKLLNHAPVTQ